MSPGPVDAVGRSPSLGWLMRSLAALGYAKGGGGGGGGSAYPKDLVRDFSTKSLINVGARQQLASYSFDFNQLKQGDVIEFHWAVIGGTTPTSTGTWDLEIDVVIGTADQAVLDTWAGIKPNMADGYNTLRVANVNGTLLSMHDGSANVSFTPDQALVFKVYGKYLGGSDIGGLYVQEVALVLNKV